MNSKIKIYLTLLFEKIQYVSLQNSKNKIKPSHISHSYNNGRYPDKPSCIVNCNGIKKTIV